MTEEIEDLLPTRRSLLSRLKNWDDQQGWREFFEAYWRLIYSVARKAGLDDSAAQDVVQETLVCVAKEIPRFRYDPAVGSFKGWLLKITRRRIVDHWRKNPGSTKAEPLATEVVEETNDAFETLWEEEWRQNLVRLAVERVKRQVNLKQFQMFDLYVTQRLPMSEVTATLGVNAAQVYMAKYRVGALFRRELGHLEEHAL